MCCFKLSPNIYFALFIENIRKTYRVTILLEKNYSKERKNNELTDIRLCTFDLGLTVTVRAKLRCY